MTQTSIINLIATNNFAEIERLFGARLSFKPLLITNDRTTNAHNLGTLSAHDRDRNLVLCAKFCIWMLANNKVDMLEHFHHELMEANDHAETSHGFCADVADFCRVNLQRLFNEPLTTEEILRRLQHIEDSPTWRGALINSQLFLDRYINICLQGIMSGEPLSLAGAFALAIRRQQHLAAVTGPLTQQDRLLIRKGERILNSNTTRVVMAALFFQAYLAIGYSQQQKGLSPSQQHAYGLAFGIMGIAASPILIPIFAVLARVISFGHLEIGRHLTEVATRMSVNTLLSQYTTHVAHQRALQNVTPSSTPNIDDLQPDDEAPADREYIRLGR